MQTAHLNITAMMINLWLGIPKWRNGFWENWVESCRKMKQDDHMSAHTKVNSKLIRDLDIRQELHKTHRRKHWQDTPPYLL